MAALLFLGVECYNNQIEYKNRTVILLLRCQINLRKRGWIYEIIFLEC